MQSNHFTVKTLDNTALLDAAKALNSLVFQNFVPDIIIGIRTGGFVVAEMMAKETPHNPVLLAISRQRVSTQKKKKIKFLKNLLRFLPYAITDLMRIMEHKSLNSKAGNEKQPFSPDIDELAALRGTMRNRDSCKILIVDDAIDSGATMKAVFDVVRAEANSACIIKTAAITVTTDSPLIQPDYKLYRYVLCRFPWSFDFKG